MAAFLMVFRLPPPLASISRSPLVFKLLLTLAFRLSPPLAFLLSPLQAFRCRLI